MKTLKKGDFIRFRDTTKPHFTELLFGVIEEKVGDDYLVQVEDFKLTIVKAADISNEE